VVWIVVAFNAIVNVPAVPAVLVTMIFNIFVVVEGGTVYKVVPTVVVAAPLNSVLLVVATRASLKCY